ncbi:MAG: SWIM zinc finger family protein [Polyangiaceae bacterium]
MLDAEALRPGTTNVDFNAGMRAALARIREGDRLLLEIGQEGVAVTHDARGDSERVVERKVKLPARWLRGLVEVQAIQRRMEQRMDLDRASAVRFLRALPRAGRPSDAAWVLPSGNGIRLGSARRDGAVRLAGPTRLAMLEPALPLGDRIAVFEDPVTGASAWRVHGRGVTLTLVLSPETWRGFSGEGQVLQRLATTEPRVADVRALLAWQSELTEDEVATRTGIAGAEVEGAFAWLATRGLVGYDVARRAWFHRVLPFDLEQLASLAEAQNPRLASARKLVDGGAVTVIRGDGGAEGQVRSDDVVHRVRLGADGARCTCPWYAKHGEQRGPCKHVLAVEMTLAAEARP